MHGTSIVALNIYDMLKLIDKSVEIQKIKLLEEIGKKSSYKDAFKKSIKSVLIVCSDTISKGEKEDFTGKKIITKLKECNVIIDDYIIIANELEIIQQKAKYYQQKGIDLIIFMGVTGLSARDITPEALRPLLDRLIPRVEEAIRRYGQDRMPYSMLSRSAVGTIAQTLVLGLPGSSDGAKESMDAIFPSILHIFKILKGVRHD